MTLSDFMQQIKTKPEDISFSDTMAIINEYYHYEPCAFKNGELSNAAGTNEGSCKILSFAQLQQLSEQQTLHLFGDYYRLDVLNDPQGTGHQNIRNFMQYGWQGVCFDMPPLSFR